MADEPEELKLDAYYDVASADDECRGGSPSCLAGPLTAISFVYISAMPALVGFEVVAVDFCVL